MTRMKWLTLAALMVAAVGFAAMISSCEEVMEACGPCGTIEGGDTTISGDPRLDGFFKAVGNLKASTGTIKARFRADVETLAAGFGVEGDLQAMSLDDLVAATTGAIETDIDAHASAGLRIRYTEPRCTANVAVAVEAQAQCEAKAECNVDYEPGELSVVCEGQCRGGCSGSCEGKCAAEVSGTCSGSCRGTCELSGAATCEGTCHGTCTGDCTLQDSAGNCKGECSGNCQGSCELAAEATCDGECHGECVVEANAACEGRCEGSCDLECTGGCEGTARPPQVDVDCEASADCQASASAQASASLECTPPSLEVDWDFDAGVNAAAQAQFISKMKLFKVTMINILKGQAELLALVEGNAEAGIDPPVVVIAEQIDLIIDAGFDDLDIAVGLLPCTLPAFQDAAEVIGGVATDVAGTISGQAEFALILFG